MTRILAIAPKFGRYLVSGGTAAATHFAVLIALVEAAAVEATVASAIGFVLACAVNYTLQYGFTFGSAVPHAVAGSRYAAVTSATLLVNTAIFWLLASMIGVPYVVAQVFATGVVVVLNFFINMHYTFAGHALRD